MKVWHNLAHRTYEGLEAQDIDLLLDHTARSVDAAAQRVRVIDDRAEKPLLWYDRLIVATGVEPAKPNIAGLDQKGVYPLRTMSEGFSPSTTP